jgi:hypothetical protein
VGARVRLETETEADEGEDEEDEEAVSFRKQRDWNQLAADARTPFMIGRLLGANEMAAILLDQEGETENARHIAQVLAAVTAYFFETVERREIGMPEKGG